MSDEPSLRYDDYSLYIVGKTVDCPYKDECKNFIIKNNLSNKIKFLGIRNDINELMTSSVATLVPSKFEGFGFITVEAMFNDCLVIGRDSAGIKEQFDNGLDATGEEIGMRFRTVDEMANCMERAVIEDTSYIRHRAKSVVTKLYTIEKSCTKIEQYYKNIICFYC